MRTRDQLARLFNIEPGEGVLVLLLLAHSFAVGVTVSFLFTAASAIYLTEFSASTLPYIYLLTAVIVTALGFVQSRLEQRLSTPQFLIGVLVFLILFVCALYLLYSWFYPGWLIFGFLIWFRVVETPLYVEFWGVATRLFTVRQAKRLLGFIGSGEFAARILGGFSVPLLLRVIDTSGLLLIAAGGLLASLGLLLLIMRQNPRQFAAAPRPVAHLEQEKPPSLFANRYLRLIFFMVIISVSGNYFIDFVLFNQMQLYFTDPDALASFIGVFWGCIQMTVFLITTFGSGRVISRYGLKVGLWILPIVFTTSVLLMSLYGTLGGTVGLFFWFVAFAKVCEDVLRYTFEKPSLRVLYSPIDALHRLAIQVAIEGRAGPLGAGLAGLVLLLYARFGAVNITYLTYMMATIFLIWIGLAIWVYRDYGVALAQSLTQRRINAAALPVVDRSSVAVIQKGLQSPQPGTVAYALALLEELAPEELLSVWPAMLDHPRPEIRLDFLQRIERLSSSGRLDLTLLLPALQPRLPNESALEVRCALLRILASRSQPETLEELQSYLDDPEPRICAAVLVGLLHSGAIDSLLTAGAKLRDLVKSPQPGERQLAARVLGEGGIAGFYQPLLLLLRDEEPMVQRTALWAAGQVRNPKLWPVVLEALPSPRGGQAAAALVAGGATVVPTLCAAWQQAEQNPLLLRRLVEVGGRVGGAQVCALLQTYLEYPDATVRPAIFQALHRCGYHAGDEAASRRVREQIRSEVAQSVWTLAALVESGASAQPTPTSLRPLQDTLTYVLQQRRTAIFFLLSFLYEAASILRAQENLTFGVAEKRAYALELLDVTLDQEQKQLIFPLLDGASPEQRLQRLRKLFPDPQLTSAQRLETIMRAPNTQVNDWTKACAAYALDGASTAPYLSSTPGGVQTMSPTVLSTIERVLALRSVALFDPIPGEVLAAVAQLCQEVQIPAGQQFLTQGEIGDSLYITLAGEVEVTVANRALARRAAPSIFGEMAILANTTRMASCVAVTPVTALRIAREDFQELLAERPELAHGIIQVLVQRLDELGQKVAN